MKPIRFVKSTIRANFDLSKWSTRRVKFDPQGNGWFRVTSTIRLHSCERVAFIERYMQRRRKIIAIDGPASSPSGYWFALTHADISNAINESEHVGYGEAGLATWRHPNLFHFHAYRDDKDGRWVFIRVTSPDHQQVSRLKRGTMGVQTRIVRSDGTQAGPWVDGTKRTRAWKAYKLKRRVESWQGSEQELTNGGSASH